MKKINILVWIVFSVTFSLAQTSRDTTAVKKTVLDYAEGFYSGDAVRIERAIYPDLNKAKPNKVAQTGNFSMQYATYSGLVEATRLKVGLLEEEKRKISIAVLNINEDMANAKLVSAKFNDYLQLVKIDNRWKIINVLWTNGTDSPKRINDFNPEEEKETVKKAVEEYMNDIWSGDTKRLESVMHPEYNRVTLTKMKDSDRVAFRKQKYSNLIENSFAKIGMVDEWQRNFQVRVLDVMDGLAVAEICTPSTFEYVQMFKGDGCWKIFNTYVKSNSNSSFYANFPPVVGYPMPDFTLPVYGGGEFTLSKNKGKNVLLIFPRGSIGKNWCKICQYTYVDLTERERMENLKKKYNMEVVFVLPYNSEKIADFIQTIPEALQEIDKMKIPSKDATLRQKELAEYARRIFPVPYKKETKDIDVSLPILVDAERVISKRFQLFTTFWDRISAEQNIPVTFIIDKDGVITFKYLSQTTYDRPDWEYLESILKKM